MGNYIGTGASGTQDLGNGTSGNDPGDGDTGPNNLQNKPVICSARTSATSTTMRSTLNSTPNDAFLIQFFSNPSGNEGKTFLGSKLVSTGSSGDVSITFSTKKAIRLGQSITAPATGPDGNTSEFSAARRMVAP